MKCNTAATGSSPEQLHGPERTCRSIADVRDRTDRLPHIYFEWTEGHPAANLIRFLFFGVEVAPVTREVIRRAEPDRDRRPAFTSVDRESRGPQLSAVSASLGENQAQVLERWNTAEWPM